MPSSNTKSMTLIPSALSSSILYVGSQTLTTSLTLCFFNSYLKKKKFILLIWFSSTRFISKINKKHTWIKVWMVWSLGRSVMRNFMFLYSISAGSGLMSFTLMLLISFWTTSGVKLLLFYCFNFYVFNNFVRHCFSLFLQFLPHYQATKAEFDNLAHRCQSYKVISHLTNWILCYFFTEDRTMGLHVDLKKGC